MMKMRAEKARLRLDDRVHLARNIVQLLHELDHDDDGKIAYSEFAQADGSSSPLLVNLRYR